MSAEQGSTDLNILHDDDASVVPLSHAPSPDQPGTLFQQLHATALYLADPLHEYFPDEAWQAARRRAMPHARGAST